MSSNRRSNEAADGGTAAARRGVRTTGDGRVRELRSESGNSYRERPDATAYRGGCGSPAVPMARRGQHDRRSADRGKA
jgi:hypothetical protein